MDGLNLKRLSWALNRAYLRRGIAVWVGLFGAVLVLALLASLGWSRLRLERAGDALAARVGELRVERGVTAVPHPNEQVETLPLPVVGQRFDITRRILAVLEKTGFAPEQIRFKFERAGDAGLTRQIAVFTLKARWSEIAAALSKLQAADRSVYISKLRVARESADDELVAAEIQLAVALVDDDVGTDADAVAGAAP